jgi:hypothetical protein
MDPVTLVVVALAAGAAAGLRDTAADAVKQAYSALLAVVKRRYPGADIASVEESPESEEIRGNLVRELQAAGAEPGPDVLEPAWTVLRALEDQDPGRFAAIGVDLERVKGAFIDIVGVTGEVGGVRVRDAEVTGGITIKDVRAGRGAFPNR